MPVGFDVSDILWCSFDCIDRGRPDSERAKFACRAMSRRQIRQLDKQREAVYAASTDQEAEEMVIAALKPWITDWRGVSEDGVAVPYGDFDAFTPRQLFAMMGELPMAVHLAERDRKNLPSPSPTLSGKPPAESATAADPCTPAGAAEAAPPKASP